MTVPLQITDREIPPSEAIDAQVRSHVDQIGRIVPRIVSCHVVLTAAGSGPQRANAYFEIHIDILVPGHTIAVDHEPTAPARARRDLHTALDRAFTRATRRLGEHPDRRDLGGSHSSR